MGKFEIQFIFKNNLRNLYDGSITNFVRATIALLIKFCLKWW